MGSCQGWNLWLFWSMQNGKRYWIITLHLYFPLSLQSRKTAQQIWQLYLVIPGQPSYTHSSSLPTLIRTTTLSIPWIIKTFNSVPSTACFQHDNSFTQEIATVLSYTPPIQTGILSQRTYHYLTNVDMTFTLTYSYGLYSHFHNSHKIRVNQHNENTTQQLLLLSHHFYIDP